MMKDFTPPELFLLGPTSNGLALSIMLKSVNTSIYNAQTSLKLAPMAPECPKMPIRPRPAPKLIKNCKSYGFL